MVARHKVGGSWVLGAALVAGLLVANAAHAGPKNGAAAGKQQVSPYAQQIAALRATVALLEKADHDYQGHRVQAIKHIRTAIHALRQSTGAHAGAHAGAKKAGVARGVKPAGGKAAGGNEPQAVSDAQLQQAAVALAGIQAQIVAGKGPGAAQAATALQAAIAELQTALKIK